jgi:hypothetical protein
MSSDNDPKMKPEDVIDPRVTAAFDISRRIAASPTEWRGDKVVTAEKTIPTPGVGMLGAITLSGVITQEGGRYKCETEVICLPMASKHKEKDLFDSLDEAKKKILESWSSEAMAVALMLMVMPKT